MTELPIRHVRAPLLPPLLLALGACTPALNWRDVKPANADGLAAQFPCKPDQAERQLTVPGLEGGPVTLHVLSCPAGDTTWALSYLAAGTPQRLAQALPALDQALWANLSANVSTADAAHAHRQDMGPSKVQGAHAHPGARVWLLEGSRPVSTTRSEPVRVATWTFA